MPKFERSPGFPERIKRIRERFELNETDFANHFGITQPTYSGWLRGSGTAAITLKRGLVSLGVWDLDRTLSWLADGEGGDPQWLSDRIDPRNPPPAPNVVAFPRRALEAFAEANTEAQAALLAGEVRSPRVNKIVHLITERGPELDVALNRPQSCGSEPIKRVAA